jgi:hypothetical protein
MIERRTQPLLISILISIKGRFSMSAIKYSREQLIRQAQISQEDLTEINRGVVKNGIGGNAAL